MCGVPSREEDHDHLDALGIITKDMLVAGNTSKGLGQSGYSRYLTFDVLEAGKEFGQPRYSGC